MATSASTTTTTPRAINQWSRTASTMISSL
jgi:hypothetical protein